MSTTPVQSLQSEPLMDSETGIAPQIQTPQVPEGPKKGIDEQIFDYFAEHPFQATAATLVGLYALGAVFKRPAAGARGQFFKGGFENKMGPSEALQILSLRDAGLTLNKLKGQHRKIMLLNHPDRGGSPYVATKINEAKSVLEKRGGLK
ncbi:Mitochondrial import inner membrane translocase subunit TIM14 [Yarrowia sp. C11]|nr:Mitochondrial import inner membrane translocase subunit TIM14 [Yarrowia sp. E02]KAG5372804.1 Mitochondrial import inner membrane translocase subunit TIM14 [Yarrowia sp. C11]